MVVAYIFFQYINIFQLSALLVVVEAIAQDKVVWNTERHIFDVQIYLQAFGLKQQCAYMHRLRTSCAQAFYHLLHCQTAFYYILNDNYRATIKVFVDAHHLLDFSCGGGALVGSQLDK